MNATTDVIRIHARALKLPGVIRNFEALARQAREHSWIHEQYLCENLKMEIDSRSHSVIQNRIREAHFPELKTLDTFDAKLSEGVGATVVAKLADCEWVENAENVIIAGPIGTGKTHLAIALGIEAARRKKRVKFYRAAEIVRALVEARDARELGSLLRRLKKSHLLVLDELGFVPFERQGGELLFNLLAERYENSSILLTTNLSFSEWPTVFGGDEKLATALIDRLAHHSTIIATKGASNRLKTKQKRS
jgi:DNA replication protein DnaC